MTTTKRTWLISLALAGGLFSGVAPAGLETKATAQPADTQPGAAVAEEPGTITNAPADSETATEKGRGGVNRETMVVIGKNAELKAGDSADVVVAIGGSAKIHGKVRDAVTAIGGDVEVDGDVGQEVVAVMGSVRVEKGARIRGDVVAVGGKVEVAEGATIEGKVHEVDLSAVGLPTPKWLQKWFVHCVLLLRPLAPQVGWVWVIAGAFFFFYMLIAVLFPRPVQVCVQELTERPATSFFLGLLTLVLLTVVLFILAVTLIGLVVVPFILAAVFFGAMLGKVAFLESLGFRLARHFGGEASLKPLGAFVVGAIIITLLYLVPILGLLTFCVVSVWGLGGAVTAAFGGLRREMPEKPAASDGLASQPMAAAPPVGQSEPAASGAPATGGPEVSTGTREAQPANEARSATATLPTPAPVLPEVLAYPKAGFWERMGAGFLDFVLVLILGIFLHPIAPLIALAYFAGLWAWKGSTIGGIVLGLKVVRLDGQPVTFPVALVRALAGAFSIFVLFLGLLWIAWDPEKQGWHDKIAGTVVLKLPRGTPLLCL
ncbi:MAG TPA: RDD family protein [Candidatus Binatia bacterium]|jgi:uncharacterized RDD family membrane protein YckC|nr:RDD family protein [Candidatus Binatia bacterium]